MYEELVALLRKKYDKAPMVMEAADAIEELSKQIKAAQCVNIGDLDCDSSQLCTCMGIVRKRLEADAKKPRWIPVTEKLPENCVDVLAYIERMAWGDGDAPYRKREIAIGYHVNGLWHVDGCSHVDCNAWMPLPELPEEATP